MSRRIRKLLLFFGISITACCGCLFKAEAGKGKQDHEISAVEVSKLGEVLISGNIKSPGPQKWKPGLTLTEAIGLSGGIGWDNGRTAVLIKRGKKTIKIRLRDVSDDKIPDPQLQDGDSIMVQR